jgi:hypothetical protein
MLLIAPYFFWNPPFAWGGRPFDGAAPCMDKFAKVLLAPDASLLLIGTACDVRFRFGI